MALVLGFCGFAVTAIAAEDGPREKVVAIAPDATLTLERSGPAVLAGLVFPDASLAQGWLASHLLQQPLLFTPVDTDRYGRTLVRSDVALNALREGVAVAYSSDDMPVAFLVAEAQARVAKRGVWAQSALILKPEQTPLHLQQFHLVEGTITHVYRGRDGTYLNFGEDWHRDFSVMIPKRVQRRFTILDRLHEGSHVRARGVLIEENGPMLRLSRPEQLELL